MPHFCQKGKTEGRIIAIPDEDSILPLGEAHFQILPAHFLHLEGNLQFYEPKTRMLFSGDMAAKPVTDFDAHLPYMQGFHVRYMVSNKVCRYWAAKVRKLDPEWIVPQHGAPLKGKQVIGRFLDWIESLSCGVDLMTQQMYTAPTKVTVTL